MFRLLKRTVRRLHLRFLRLRPSLPCPTGSAFPSCPLCYLLPCRNQCQAHQKHIVKSLAKTSKRQGDRSFEYTPQYAYGGPGGSRTRVQNTFLFASYSNNYYLSPGLPSDPMLYLLHTPRQSPGQCEPYPVTTGGIHGATIVVNPHQSYKHIVSLIKFLCKWLREKFVANQFFFLNPIN